MKKRLMTTVTVIAVRVLRKILALDERGVEVETEDPHDLHALRADTGPTTVHEGAGGVDDGILTVNPARTTLASSVCPGAKRPRTSRVLGGRM